MQTFVFHLAVRSSSGQIYRVSAVSEVKVGLILHVQTLRFQGYLSPHMVTNVRGFIFVCVFV